MLTPNPTFPSDPDYEDDAPSPSALDGEDTRLNPDRDPDAERESLIEVEYQRFADEKRIAEYDAKKLDEDEAKNWGGMDTPS